MHWQNTPRYNQRQRLIGTALLLAAMVSSWLVFQTSLYQVLDKIIDEHQADAFMENVHAIHFDELGKIEAEFFSPQMRHYPIHNMTKMDKPRFIIHVEDRAPWEITALNGKAYQGIKRLALWNQVVGYEPKSIHNAESTIKTDSMMVFPSQKYAQTDNEVIAMQPGLTVRSMGAHVDLSKHTIELLAKVRGEYVPSH